MPSQTPSPSTNPESNTDTTASARGLSSPLTQIRMSSLRGSAVCSWVPVRVMAEFRWSSRRAHGASPGPRSRARPRPCRPRLDHRARAGCFTQRRPARGWSRGGARRRYDVAYGVALATMPCLAQRKTPLPGISPATSRQTMPAETSGSRGVTRTWSTADRCQALLELGRLVDGALDDGGPADPLVEGERLVERPAVLEGVVAAGGEASAVLEPGERRDQLGQRPEVAAPQDARAARAEQPLVGAGRQEVAAQVGQVDVDGRRSRARRRRRAARGRRSPR